MAALIVLSSIALAAAGTFIMAALKFGFGHTVESVEPWALAGSYFFILVLLLSIVDFFIPRTLRLRLTRAVAITNRAFTRVRQASERLVLRPRIWQLWDIIIVGTALILFWVPWFWFEWGEGDYGGDASRLYLLDPWAYLTHRALVPVGLSDFGFEAPEFVMLPFVGLLQALKVLFFNSPSVLLNFTNGLLLTTAFVATYAVIRNLQVNSRPTLSVRAAAYLGSLLFVGSPIIMFSWFKPLYRFHEIALYPLLMWLLLRFIQQRSYRPLLVGLLVTGAFSLNFGFQAAPSLFAAWPFLGLLVAVYSIIQKRLGHFLRGLVVFLALFLAVHAFHILPQILAFTNTSGVFHQSVFSAAGKVNRGSQYFEGVRPMVRLTYNLARLPQYSLYTQTVSSKQFLELLYRYEVSMLPWLLGVPIMILFGLVMSSRDANRSQRGLFLAATLLFMLTLFFMTATMFEPYGPRFYARLFAVPGFAMFRSFYGVFSFIFAFLYALVSGLALTYLFRHFHHQLARWLIIGLLVVPLGYGAIPFLRGDIVNSNLPDTNNVSIAHRFSPEFNETLAWVSRLSLNAKFLAFPLTHFDYQIIEGEHGGVYVGPSPLAFLAGKPVFTSVSSFDVPDSALFNQDFFLDRLLAQDVVTLDRLFSLLGIDFIFLNRSPLVYTDAFVGWPYSRDIWSVFSASEDFARLAQHLGYRPVYEHGPYVIYQYPDFFLPPVSVPRTIVKRHDPREFKDYVITKEGYDIRTAFYRDGAPQNDVVAAIPNSISDPPAIEFRQLSPAKYRIRIHNLKTSVPLIFSSAFHQGWKLIPVQASLPQCLTSSGLPSFTSQPGGASAEELASSCEKDVIGTVGPDYISRSFNGTIQNDNLPPSVLWDTWGKLDLAERYHVRVNEYANSWWLNVAHLKAVYPHLLIERSDGAVEAEFILEFTPQRSFYVGVVVSVLTVVGVVAALLWPPLRNRRYERVASKLGAS